MRHTPRLLLCVFGISSLSLLPVAAHAVPGLLHLQGHLTKADGSPETENRDITLKLYDAPQDGVQLWCERHNDTGFSEGNFSIYMGNGSACPGQPDQDLTPEIFAGGDTYLEIGVRATTLPGRVRIGGAAYALVADTARVCEVADHLSEDGIAEVAPAVANVIVDDPNLREVLRGQDGIQGVPGAPGEGCRTEAIPDGSGIFVVCGESESAVLHGSDGAIGADGQDGESCSVTRQGDGITVTCGQESVRVLD